MGMEAEDAAAAKFRRTVLDGPGESDPSIRNAAAAGVGVPGDLQALQALQAGNPPPREKPEKRWMPRPKSSPS